MPAELRPTVTTTKSSRGRQRVRKTLGGGRWRYRIRQNCLSRASWEQQEASRLRPEEWPQSDPMNSEREIGTDLLRRLLAGERGSIQSHLAKLLEKSCPLHDSDDFYRWVLPPELADVRLSKETSEEIIAALCAEVSCNPDEALISAMSFTGADLVTKTVAVVLASPPRPLAVSEYAYALSLVSKFLPDCLAEDPQFVPKADLERIVKLAKELQNLEDSEPNKAWRVGIRRDADNLLKRLAQLGIVGS